MACRNFSNSEHLRNTIRPSCRRMLPNQHQSQLQHLHPAGGRGVQVQVHCRPAFVSNIWASALVRSFNPCCQPSPLLNLLLPGITSTTALSTSSQQRNPQRQGKLPARSSAESSEAASSSTLIDLPFAERRRIRRPLFSCPHFANKRFHASDNTDLFLLPLRIPSNSISTRRTARRFLRPPCARGAALSKQSV